jgi:hypothetical protein
MKSTIDQHQQGTISGNIRSYSTALHGELQALGAEEGGIAFNALRGILSEIEGVRQLEVLPFQLLTSLKEIEGGALLYRAESISSAMSRYVKILCEEFIRLGAKLEGIAFHALNGIASEVERISGLEALFPNVFHVEAAHSGKLLALMGGADVEVLRQQFKNAAYELAYMDAR